MTDFIRKSPIPTKNKSKERILGERLIDAYTRNGKLEEQLFQRNEQILNLKMEMLSLNAENEMLKRKLKEASPATSPVPIISAPVEEAHNPFLFEDIFEDDGELRRVSEALTFWNNAETVST